MTRCKNCHRRIAYEFMTSLWLDISGAFSTRFGALYCERSILDSDACGQHVPEEATPE